ncbi:MAG: methylenetetrahydrofolate reductase, partial [Cellulosilyticum sp.]|nr:methylenetetrahydrofolate reductase [Cellulosilyticum sp.]
SEKVNLKPVLHQINEEIEVHKQAIKEIKRSFLEEKALGEKILAVELSPPPDANYEKIMDAANVLKRNGVDILTFPDSPSGRMRADSILMSVKVANEVKINVLPHICCRDRNAIAIRSELLGAHINGVKNVLVITGDPVPAMVRENVKSVFNFDSVGVMKTIQEMNEDQFKDEPMIYGGALNYNRRNIETEVHRINKKIAAGAKFFLSQPIFTSEDAEKLRYIKSRVDTKILCGIMPLVSQRNANFIKNEMADIHVTDEIVNLFAPEMSKVEGEAVGVNIARQMIAETKDFVDGYYFSIPFNRVYLLEQILD